MNLFDINTWIGNFTSNFVADVIVAFIFGIVVTKLLERKDKTNELIENKKKSREKLQLAAVMLWDEIEHNRNQLKILIKELPRRNIPYPAVEISAWEVVDKKIVIDGLKVKDVKALLYIYNRMKTINSMYSIIIDKANLADGSIKKPVIKREFLYAFIKRCEEALVFIDKYIPEKHSIK